MAAAVFVAFIALGIYDTKVDYGYGLLGSTIGITDLVSISALLLGMEIYGRDPEPDIEVVTAFTPVPTTI